MTNANDRREDKAMERPRLNIDFLNHASVLIEAGGLKLLTDPWFFGTAFKDGWELRWQNPRAWELAAAADVLWISHFHEDHFHIPTLKRLVGLNSSMTVLSNDSFNFQFSSRLRDIGFKNILFLPERVTMRLSDAVTVCRYPATGIDNMLHLRAGDVSVLNFNDCVLSGLAKRLLTAKLGPIDVLLVNFNHAGKLLLDPLPADSVIKERLQAAFATNVAPFKARYVLPIASYHYYRAPESQHQNASMLVADELGRTAAHICPWRVGSRVAYDPESHALTIQEPPASVTPAEQTVIERASGASEAELQAAASSFAQALRSCWGPLVHLVPRLLIDVIDLKLRVAFRPGTSGLQTAAMDEPAHIAAHSSALYAWWGKKYGTNGFMIGAHFSLLAGGRRRLMWYVMMGMLMDNLLAPKHMLRMLVTAGGLRFLFNRREEILGIVVTRQVAPDYQRQLAGEAQPRR